LELFLYYRAHVREDVFFAGELFLKSPYREKWLCRIGLPFTAAIS